MKIAIFNVLFAFALLASFCKADFLSELKDKKNDILSYLKVTDIARSISFNKKRRTLDVYYKKDEPITELKPVVIWFYGGTWYKGDRVKFTKLGTLVEENDYVGVIPNYVLFPFGSMEDMVYDVYTAIKWTFDNISRYGGDPNRIIVSGHSAGAHLITLSVLKSYLGIKNKGEILEPLPHIEKLVLVSAPYDFDDLKLFNIVAEEEDADNTIVEQIGKIVLGTQNISPHDLIRDLPDNSVTDSFNVGKFVLYYTDNDDQVPERSVKKFMKQLRRVDSNVDIQYVYTEKGYTHISMTMGIRHEDKEQCDLYLELLRL